MIFDDNTVVYIINKFENIYSEVLALLNVHFNFYSTEHYMSRIDCSSSHTLNTSLNHQ